MDNTNSLTNLKIIIFGSCSVGKTSILNQLLHNRFSDVQATIGVDFKLKKYNYDGKIVNLALWDTAGMERFHSLPSNLYRDVQGAVLVYDVTNYQSFRELHRWMSDLQSYFEGLEKQPVVIVLGNKIDLDGREVQRSEGSNFAKRHRALFLETSAKTSIGVEAAFDDLVTKILDTPGLWRSNMGSVVALHQQQDPSTTWFSNCNQC